MDDASVKQTTMVSRLPKFGSRAPSASAPLHNGSALAASSGWHKVVPLGKQNGMIPIPSSLAAKGKKAGGEGKAPDLGEDAREARGILRPQAQPRSPATVKQIKKPLAGIAAKVQRSTSTAASTKIVSQSTRASPRPKQAAGKSGVNGVASGRGSSSSESLKSLSLDTVVRSQSFTYLKSPATPTDPPLTRSFSFNRAAELAKELPRPLSESPIARSPVTQPGLALDGNDEGPFGGASNTSSFPASALKKSLLPSCGGYKLAYPSLIRQPRPIRPSKVQAKSELSDRDGDSPLSDSLSKPSSNPESADTTPEEPSKEDGSRGAFLDVLEDMSMSSTSSLGHNDISEEYMDDFDDLGNGAGILLMPVHEGESGQLGITDGFVSQLHEGLAVSGLHSFASEMVDWAEMGLTGGRKGLVGSHRRASRPLSAGQDLAHGSSLDLSPSDSSGGTYMWDEEVLEPLGPGAQLCRSYDSNLNSVDILNNLENLDSCDLEDDDLMLDVDLPEDASLRSDVSGVSRYDRSDAEFWPWRKRQQRGRKERLNEDDGDGVEDVRRLSRSDSGPTAVDELILKHMTQDCSSVKEQLLQLRRLLQVDEDDDAEDFVSSPSEEDQSYQQQVEELLKEVQTLREELRLKEKLIVTLVQNMRPPLAVTPCRCQQEDFEGVLQRREQQDKGTQTPLRVQNPQILQPSRASASGHRKLARPSSQALSGAPSDHVDTQSSDCPVRPLSCTLPVLPVSATDHSARPSSVPSTAPVTAATSPCRALNSDDLVLLVNNSLGVDDSHGGSEHKRQSGILNKPLSLGRGTVAMPRTRLLPPPKRVLSCINPGVRMNSENGSVRALPCNSRLPKPKSH